MENCVSVRLRLLAWQPNQSSRKEECEKKNNATLAGFWSTAEKFLNGTFFSKWPVVLQPLFLQGCSKSTHIADRASWCASLAFSKIQERSLGNCRIVTSQSHATTESSMCGVFSHHVHNTAPFVSIHGHVGLPLLGLWPFLVDRQLWGRGFWLTGRCRAGAGRARSGGTFGLLVFHRFVRCCRGLQMCCRVFPDWLREHTRARMIGVERACTDFAQDFFIVPQRLSKRVPSISFCRSFATWVVPNSAAHRNLTWKT